MIAFKRHQNHAHNRTVVSEWPSSVIWTVDTNNPKLPVMVPALSILSRLSFAVTP